MSSHRQLQPNGIFAALSQPTLDDLDSHGEFYDTPKDSTIIEEGAYQDELFYVISGKLDVLIGDKVVATISEGECIGEANLFFASAASATVRTTEASELWKISKTQMASFVIDNKDSGMSIMSSVICLLSERLQSSNTDLAAQI